MPRVNILLQTQNHSLHYTTFPELRNYALDKVEAAYESLPLHDTLTFELVDQDVLAFFPKRVNVATARLVLGHIKDTSTQTPVYAYICRKEQISQALLRLGTKLLKVSDLDNIDFQSPFDAVYDIYGMTDRAGDKLSTLAAYYFLAAGHVKAITTRRDFKNTFVALCRKIHVPVITYSAALIVAMQAHHEIQQENDHLEDGRGLPLQNTAKDTNAGMSDSQAWNHTIHHTPVPPLKAICSPAVGEASNLTPHAALLPHSNQDDQSTDKICVMEADTTQSSNPQSKSPNINDLTIFVTEFKKLQSENAHLHRVQTTITNLPTLLNQSRRKEHQASSELEELRNMHKASANEIARLRKQLDERVADADTMHKKVQHDLGRQEVQTHLAKLAEREARKQVEVLEGEKRELEKRLAKANLGGASKDKMDAMKADVEGLKVENEALKGQVGSLEEEVEKEKHRFAEYKRKIRNLTIGA